MMNGNVYIGARLIKDIFSNNGQILLAKNTILRKEHLIKLENHSIYLSEHDIEHSYLLSFGDNNNSNQSILLIQDTVSTIKEIFNQVRNGNHVPLTDIKDNIVPSVQIIAKDPNVFNLLLQLQNSNEYTYHHNIAVSVIATMLGEWMRLSSDEISLLTVGALLHDIGKTKIPTEILDKPGKLNEEEFSIIKNHTIYGYELIKNTVGASPRIALIALQHHEREDGKGYPSGVKESAIEYLSKIVAIADVFHAMASDRVYHKAKPFYIVLQEMRDNIFGQLNPKIMNVFLTRIMELLIGNKIMLSDGRQGTVILTNPHYPTQPIVQLDNHQIIDLKKETNVHLEKILTH